MEEHVPAVTTNTPLWKILAALIAVLLLSAIVAVSALAEDIDIADVVEIVSAEYEDFTEGIDDYTKYDWTEGKSYTYYYVYFGNLNLVLRMADGSLMECTGYYARTVFGDDNFKIDDGQSVAHPWGVGDHICRVTIGQLTKEFKITVQPTPVDHLIVTQKHLIIKDVSKKDMREYLSVVLCNKDGTETESIGGMAHYEPSYASELQLGHNTVTVTCRAVSAEVDVEVIENPYMAITIREEEPLALLLTKKDNTQETIRIDGGYKENDGTWCLHCPVDVEYHEGTFSIGEIKSNTIPDLRWMEAMDIIHGDDPYLVLYASSSDYVNGAVTQENIDSLFRIAMGRGFIRGGLERDKNDIYTLKDVQDQFSLVFGEDNVDLTLSKYYDPETNTIHYPGGWADNPDNRVLTFENGQYVYRRYSWGEEGITYEEEPWLVVTYDADLHITGIYLHDINTSSNLPGDVDGDGDVTSGDARLALRAAVGLENYASGSVEFLAADADKNGELTAADARQILRAAVGLESLS